MSIYTDADTEALAAAFNGRRELLSRYEPQFPLQAERKYRRFLERLKAGELDEKDIDRELAAIAALIIFLSLTEWEKEITQTLGIAVDIEYYRVQLENTVFLWVSREAQRIRRHIITHELDSDEQQDELVGLLALAIGGTGDLFAACMGALAAHSYSQRYKWITENDHLVRPYHAALHDTIQYWEAPPIISEHGYTGHPSDDFNCRCTAQMIFTNPFF